MNTMIGVMHPEIVKATRAIEQESLRLTYALLVSLGADASEIGETQGDEIFATYRGLDLWIEPGGGLFALGADDAIEQVNSLEEIQSKARNCAASS